MSHILKYGWGNCVWKTAKEGLTVEAGFGGRDGLNKQLDGWELRGWGGPGCSILLGAHTHPPHPTALTAQKWLQECQGLKHLPCEGSRVAAGLPKPPGPGIFSLQHPLSLTSMCSPQIIFMCAMIWKCASQTLKVSGKGPGEWGQLRYQVNC